MEHAIQVLILGVALGFVYALMASGLTLIFGVMRIVNLAHPILILCGAYVAYWLFKLLAVDPIVAVPVAALGVAAIGTIIYKLVFEKEAGAQRYSEMTVLLTFGIALVMDGLLSWLFSNTQRVTSPAYATDAIFIGNLFIPSAQMYAGLFSLLIILGLTLFLKYSSLGVAIRATAQNRVSASLVGVNVRRVCTISFAIGCALAGAAGALVSFVFSFFPARHWEWIAILMSLVVLGGMGRLAGAVAGAILLSVIGSFVSAYISSSWSTMVFFLALFLILLFRPQGLFGSRAG